MTPKTNLSPSARQSEALALAARALPSFPCRPRAKEPLTGHGFKDATTDPAQIEAWWGDYPDANIAIATGAAGLLVLDVDPRHGGDETLHELERAHGELPAAPRVKTGGGGEHIYFLNPNGIGCSAGKLGPGLDVKAKGGYVLAPGSLHPSGRPYEWSTTLDEAPIAEPPAWIVERLQRVERSTSLALDVIAEGGRNAGLTSLAGKLRRPGFSEAEMLAALSKANAARCKPPLPDAEVAKIAASVARYAPAAPSVADPAAYPVTFTEHKPPRLELPPLPSPEDHAGHAAWLTSVLRLDLHHPVTSAVHEGLRGQEGHVAIRRAEAPDLRFEPAALISMARRLRPALIWQLQPTDGEPYGFKDEHASRIAHVVRLLCGTSRAPSEAQETTGIIGTYLADAAALEGFSTYGSSGQRYEALEALRPEMDSISGRVIGGARYLVDADTGELVIRVGDLQHAARRHIGSVPHGWLDARMDNLGWRRVTLQGYQLSGRDGRQGPHLRSWVYRGVLPGDDEAVNT